MAGITLVLGGGGFKGLAHLGALTVLEDAGIPIERVIGTSAGSLIGTAYCSRASASDTHHAVMAFVQSDEFGKHSFAGLPGGTAADASTGWMGRVLSGLKRQVAMERMFRRSSAFGGTALRFIARSLIPKGNIEDLAVACGVSVLNLSTGQVELIQRGHANSAVVASSSVPGYFPPVEREGVVLCDPGVVDNLPTGLARAIGARNVVAVDLSADLPGDTGVGPLMGIEALFRAQDITTCLGNRRAAQAADVIVRPRLGARNWLDPTDPVSIVTAGEEAMQRALPTIRRMLSEASRRAAS